MEPIDPKLGLTTTTTTASTTVISGNIHDPRSPTETLLSGDMPASSMGTSREEEEDSSNQNSSDCKSSGQR